MGESTSTGMASLLILNCIDAEQQYSSCKRKLMIAVLHTSICPCLSMGLSDSLPQPFVSMSLWVRGARGVSDQKPPAPTRAITEQQFCCSSIAFSLSFLHHRLSAILNTHVPAWAMSYCCGRFFNANGYCNHIAYSATHAVDHECNYCNECFRWKKNRVKHEEEKNWQYCQNYNWMFRIRKNLNDHVQRKHPVKCDICDKTFGQQSALNQHMNIAAGHHNYCYNCQRAFVNPNALNMVSVNSWCELLFSDMRKASEIIRSSKQERQMSLMLGQIYQPYRRHFTFGIWQVSLKHWPSENRSVLSSSEPRSSLHKLSD